MTCREDIDKIEAKLAEMTPGNRLAYNGEVYASSRLDMIAKIYSNEADLWLFCRGPKIMRALIDYIRELEADREDMTATFNAVLDRGVKMERRLKEMEGNKP